MSIYDFQPINLDEINTYELASRPSKVTVKDFAKPVSVDDSLKEFLEKLPNILAVQSIREIAKAIKRAKSLNKPIIWGIGGHVIKTGLSPTLIDLMNRGFVSAIAGNGAVLVHDTEIALVGFTSEDVDATLGEGDFGAAYRHLHHVSPDDRAKDLLTEFILKHNRAAPPDWDGVIPLSTKG